jgi:hypothetical protein
MSLSPRARKALRDYLGAGADLDRPEEVARASYEALKCALSCGPRTLREIRLWPRERGRDLAGVPAPPPGDGTRATWIDHGVYH